jgi:hypothetical protein
MTKPVSKPFLHPDTLLSGAKFGDTYSLAVNGLELDAIGASQQVFGQVPGWIKWIAKLQTRSSRRWTLTVHGQLVVADYIIGRRDEYGDWIVTPCG